MAPEQQAPGDDIDARAEHVATTNGDAVEGPEIVDGLLDADLPAEIREIVVRAVSHRGPLPSPERLAQYDEVVPGLARTIVEQWQGETAARHEHERFNRETDRLEVEARYANQRLGLHYGLGATVLVLGVVVVAILAGYELLGVAGLLTPIPWIIWAMRRDPSGPATLDAPADDDME